MIDDNDDNPSKFSRDDLSEFAKIGGSFLKKTIDSGVKALNDVTKSGIAKEATGLAKEATQFINRSRDDIFKGISREMAQAMVGTVVDKIFENVEGRKLEISIGLSEKRKKITRSRKVRRLYRKQFLLKRKNDKKEENDSRDEDI